MNSTLILTGCLLAAGLPALQAAIPTFTEVVVDLTPPSQTHTKAAADVDGDGFIDLLIGSGQTGDGLYWYQYPNWTRHTIVPPGVSGFSTDMQMADVDLDGDMDVIVPKGFFFGQTVWWYENPRPGGNPATDAWVEHLIGDAGLDQAHDMEVGDVNNDGKIDVVVRRRTTTLFLQVSPTIWTKVVLHDSLVNAEGLDLADLDQDGDLDVVINGDWLENPLLLAGNPAVDPWVVRPFVAWTVDAKVQTGDLDGNGKLDIVLGQSESSGGRLSWFEAADPKAGPWIEHVIDATADYNHSVQLADIDLDGNLDVAVAEMHQSSDPDEVRVFYNTAGTGLSWTERLISNKGSHNFRIVDIDGDGDFDIFGANWDGSTGVDLWRNNLDPMPSLDNWQKHLIDGAMPWQPLLLTPADIDGDGKVDIVTGGWWYKNPGNIGGVWVRNTIGANLNNMAWVHDFDNDGDLDVFGSDGTPSGGAMSWARNNGTGTFTIFSNVDFGQNVFFQGAAGGIFSPGAPFQVAMQWQGGEDGDSGVEGFTVPADPTIGTWTKTILNPTSLGEALSAADLDGDGDVDLFQGSGWLRNEGGGVWTHFTVATFLPGKGGPDRNRLADIDGDGDLDAVVGFSHFTDPDTYLLWLEHPADPTQPWPQHVVVNGVWGGYSLDVGDIDFDGDIDIVLGEHRGATRALIYENVGGGSSWVQHLVDAGGAGIDHHAGTTLVDLDGDDDLDIVSIGWDNDKLWIFENKTSVVPDILPPSVPANVVAVAVASFQVNLSWAASTDNKLVAGYRVFRNGALVATTSSEVYSDTGLPAQTQFSYRILAFDPAGNQSAQSSPVSVMTPTPDTEPPTPPSGLTATPFSTSVRLAWNAASDNRTVGGYRIFQGPSQISTTTNLTYTVTGLAPNTGYGFMVSAFDLEGNESNPAQSTVNTTTLGTFFVGYPFEESAGAAVFDKSGNANNALLEGGAIRKPAGYLGKAIEFNGLDSRVNMGPVNPTGAALTIALWFKADDFDITDARLISKALGTAENDHFFMLSTISTGGGIGLRARLKTTVGGTITLIGSGPLLVPGVWTHVAVTYDGTTLTLYQNGVAVGSVGKTGSVASGPMVETWIGANPGGTRYFDGCIDEVRLYLVALSAGEIQAVMNTAMDTQAPTNPGNLVATAVSTTQINLSWSPSTDNVAVSGYRIYRGGILIGTSTSTSFSNTGLSSGSTYTYQVTAVDAASNESGFSGSAQATTYGTLTLSIVGEGSVMVDPSQPSYPAGTIVQLTAVPQFNWLFDGWSEDLTGSINPESLTVTGNHQVTATFVLDNNTPPTVSDIPDQNVNEDEVGGPINFVVGDLESPPGTLTLSGSSTDMALVPEANIVFGGSGSNRTVTVTPTANASGSSTITVMVSDGTLMASDVFLFTVDPVNDVPTISAIADQTINQGGSTGALAFTIDDLETSPDNLILATNSSNPTLVPATNIVLGGSGANRTVTVTPSPNESGTSTISITVSDGTLSATNSFLLTVQPPMAPSIVTPPANVTVTEPAAAMFNATASGTPPLSYQWRRGGADISGATASNYTLTPTSAAADDGAQFAVVVSNSSGSVTSVVATLTVSAAPSIVTPPANVTVTAPAAAMFSVVANGTAPLSYQWRRGGVNIGGATGTSYTLDPTAAGTDNGAQFRVVVSNSAGSVTSVVATLTVNAPPSIQTQPANVTVVQPAAAMFSVGASGTVPLSYQWRRNGANIGGATSSSYTINPTSAGADNGAQFRVVVSNGSGSVTSVVATLTVNVANPRVTSGLVALYDFAAGSGTTVHDVSGVGTPMNLTILDPARIQWLGTSNGVRFVSAGSAIRSSGAATKVHNALTASSRVTFEAWLTPDSLAQFGPARIATLSEGTASSQMNLHVGQGGASSGGDIASFRLRTSVNSFSWLQAGGAFNSTVNARHVVVTYDGTAQRVYVDGVQMGSVQSLSGNFSNWTGNYPFVLGNEATLDRSWLGRMYLVAVYDRALSLGEVQQNFAVGPQTGSALPQITTAPANLTVTAPASAMFSVVASGTPPLSYQWRRNGGNIAGATGSSYTLSPTSVGVDNGAEFAVVVSNASGSVTSVVATLTVNAAGQPPSIVTPPANVTVSAPAPAMFSAVANGTAPLSYQWRRNGANIPGATATSYTLAPTAAADSGAQFAVVVSNASGSVTSVVATLTVNAPPGIVTPPANLTVAQPNAANFNVVASGTSPLSYQWRRGGANISGATASNYTLTPTSLGDSGAQFAVVVSNGFGSVTSVVATLTVTVASQPPAIVTPPANLTVIAPASAMFSVGASGTAPLSYQWQRGGVNIAGATGTSYTLDPTAAGTDNGAQFRVVVSNVAGSVTSAVATLTVNAPPSIQTQPANVTVLQPAAAMFSVGASGTTPLSYQWRRGGVNLSGATTSGYTLNPTSAGADNGAQFRVVVSNGFGSVTSVVATLTVNAASPRVTAGLVALYDFAAGSGTTVHDVSGVGIPMDLTILDPARIQWLGTSNGVRFVSAGSAIRSSGAATKVHNALTASSRVTFEAWLTPDSLAQFGPARIATLSEGTASSQMNLHVGQGGASSGGDIASFRLRTSVNSFSWLQAGGAFNSTVNARHVVVTYDGTAQRVYVNGALMGSAQSLSGNFSNWTGNYPFVLGNEATLDRSWLGRMYLVAVYDRALSLGEVQQNFAVGPQTGSALPQITTAPANLTVTAPASAMFSVVASGTPPLSYQWRRNGGNIAGATGSSYTLSPTSVGVDNGAEFAVVVSNASGSVTSVVATLTVNAAGQPPSIVTPPANMTVTAPAAASLSVVASGTAPLSYQWRRGGANIGGATASSYTLTPTSAGDSGAQFAVVVSNASGSVTSVVATLTVNAPPIIQTQPVNVTVFQPAGAAFSVVASGAAPLSYQWRRGGTNIGGATGSSYTLNPTSVGDNAAQFRVVVSNGFGSVTSLVATLTVEDQLPSAGLALWLKGDVGVVLDGSAITTWLDQSGNNRHAEQAIGSSRPTLLPGVLNGRPVARFDGINDFLTFQLPLNGQGGLTMFLVAANTANQTGGPSQGAEAALFWNENQFWGVTYLTPFQSRVNFRFGTTQSGNIPTYIRPASIGNQFSLSTAVKNGTTDSLYVNHNLVLSEAGKFTTMAGGLDTGNLGRGFNNNTYFAGDIAEVVVYTRALSAIERQAVAQYLDMKYGLTVQVPPQITVQPANVTVNEPTSANFSVTAGGSEPLFYQWRRGGVNIPGATGSSYVLSPTSVAGDNGAQFSVVVSSAVGAVTSQTATLTVNVPPPQAPIIVTQPANQSVFQPNPATFSVSATGTAPLSYQWRRGGVNIPGATGSSYTLNSTSIGADNGAQFSVVVSNGVGMMTSQTATLTVFGLGSVPPSGLALWLRADAGLVSGGSGVSQWNDQSGNGRHAAQGSSGSQPALAVDGMSGSPVVRFDGVNDFLSFGLPVNGLTGVSVFIVTSSTLNNSPVGPQQAALFWNETGAWGTIYVSPYRDTINMRFGTTQVGNGLIYSRPSSLGSGLTITTAIKDGSAESLFVDGTLVFNQGGKFTTITACRDTGNVGRGFDDNTYFAGDIAEILVYNRAVSGVERLSIEQYLDAKYLFSSPAAPQIVTEARTSTAAGVAYEYLLSAGGNPAPTYYLSQKPAGMVIDQFTGLISWTPTVGQVGSHAVTAVATNSQGSDQQSFSLTVVQCPAGLMAYWRLDETSGVVFRDSVGQNHASCISAICPTPTAGRVSGGLLYDETLESRISAPPHPSIDFGASESFTLEVWARTEVLGEVAYFGRIELPSMMEFSIGQDVNARPWFYLRDKVNGTINDLIDPNPAPGTPTWRHVVGVRDKAAEQARLYVDGVLVNTRNTAGVFSGDFASSTATLDIGWINLTHGFQLGGSVDEVAIYRRALSGAEILQHYNAGLANLPVCSE